MRQPSAADGLVHILIDSTGLKAYRGRTPPADRRNRRTWRKLHLVVDLTTAEIRTSKITTHCTRDTTPVSDLLAPITRGLASVRADGAYDSASVYYAIENHQSAPPYSDPNSDPAGAQYEDQRRPRRRQRPAHCQHQAYCSPRPTPLAESVQIHTSQSGRGLVETAMSRVKNEFGGALRRRTCLLYTSDAADDAMNV